ncbi:MAG: DNA-binding protein [Gammaproteobacteria bacterium]|nr:DNA-binding protein [Gammaproteobacteria bacterium]
MEKQIIIIANQLKQQGKKPSVATVRSRLTGRVNIPTLLKALQQFDAMSQEDIDRVVADTPSHQPQKQPTAGLQQQIDQLQQDVAGLKQQVAQLTAFLKQDKHDLS